MVYQATGLLSNDGRMYELYLRAVISESLGGGDGFKLGSDNCVGVDAVSVDETSRLFAGSRANSAYALVDRSGVAVHFGVDGAGYRCLGDVDGSGVGVGPSGKRRDEGDCGAVSATTGGRVDGAVVTVDNVGSAQSLDATGPVGSGTKVWVEERRGSRHPNVGVYVPPQARADGTVRGRHYAANRATRERRKKAKSLARGGQDVDVLSQAGVHVSKAEYGTFAACSLDQREELQRTRARRLVAENELKTAEAQRKLELLRAQDVAQLKKRQETKLMRDTELNKVQVEQAFSKLAGTGNVPGFAQTVVTDDSVPSLQSGSISPNSSISAAEVHAMQKEILEFRRREEIIARREPALYAEVVAAKLASVQTGWTVDEDGRPTGWIGDGVGGMIGPDGRLHDYDDYAEY